MPRILETVYWYSSLQDRISRAYRAMRKLSSKAWPRRGRKTVRCKSKLAALLQSHIRLKRHRRLGKLFLESFETTYRGNMFYPVLCSKTALLVNRQRDTERRTDAMMCVLVRERLQVVPEQILVRYHSRQWMSIAVSAQTSRK